MSHNAPLESKLVEWSERHAMLMGLAVGGLWFHAPPEFLAAMAAASFLGLIRQFRRQWTPAEAFGAANAITLIRLIGTFFLLLFPIGNGWLLASIVLLILYADGLDGWVARRWKLASPFGDCFDKEVDAFFFLALCLLLYNRGHLGVWVLFPGMLRYLFVLFVKIAGPPCRVVEGNWFTRSVSVIAIIVFTLCLLPVGLFCTELAMTATAGLCVSFLYSLVQLRRPQLRI
ncbi:CDP-alcohol phosphatidyltransferase family protein [Methylocaldum sp.]|uniref:CDP-alcohol phosphatidyltransferase family protein n=1 Tax=Methylocaldum sp. TaxID=1969727 RepID=UPI002D2ECF19|nr:CDP-alcohol phosphatidyltransferase family protein [Methylocaldum sp.]HYE36906.1 CDP-alcohol phosphatidyltransferase family protein [Methylocaldum sp.]